MSYEVTGSELASLLKESKEIKDVQPEINRAQKNKVYNYAIVKGKDKTGYFRYEVVKGDKTDVPLSFFGSRKSALGHIEYVGEIYQLCHKVNRIDKSRNSCFGYEVGKGMGACIGDEPMIEYNERFAESEVLMNRLFEENFLILEEGRSPTERAVFLVEEGHYRGFGFVDGEDVGYGVEELKEAVKYEPVNPEADLILRNYLLSHEKLEVLHF